MFRMVGTVFAGLVGLAFGSFLNVCLSRWPAGESVVKPRSHCRACGRMLTWWENVPVLSWIALRGHCRTCGAWIGWRYPVVELAVGVLWAIACCRLLYSLVESPERYVDAVITAIGMAILVWLLVGLAIVDAEHLWLPDFVTLPGIALGIGMTLVRMGPLVAISGRADSALNQLLELASAIVTAAGLILAIRWIYWLVRRREGIGLGDAKLMAMLAAWLGLPGALVAFAIGVVLGALVGIAILLTSKVGENTEPAVLTKLPLGTFLCIGGIVSALWGQPILAAYLRWAGFS